MTFRSQNRTFILDFIQENDVLKTCNNFNKVKRKKKSNLATNGSKASKAKSNTL